MKRTVIIAAAGVGSRLGAGLPKCLVSVCGHAIFEYQLKAFAWADEIRMVVGYMADEVMKQAAAVDPDIVFIHNKDFLTTNLRQSYFLGAQGVEEKALFLDGDTIMGRTASNLLLHAYEVGEDYIAVTQAQTRNPIYAGVQDGKVQWFSYNKPSDYELANAAFLAVNKLAYKNTLFYVQLEKYLPTKAVFLKSLEVDTPDDFRYVTQAISAHMEEYNFWGNEI